jgi:flagellar motor switch protein FliN/FliY
MLIFPESDAPILADLVGGGGGTPLPTPLDDDQKTLLANAMQAAAQGLGILLGNVRGLPVEIGSCATALEPLSLPPSFAMSGQAVQVSLAYQIESVLDGTLRLLFTPELARAMSGISEASAGAEADDFHTEGAEAQGDAAPPVMPTLEISEGGLGFSPMGMSAPAGPTLPPGMDLILDIPLEISVELGRTQMLIKDVLELSSGSIVELESVAGAPIDLLVNGCLIAKGEVVVIEDNFGIRLTEIISPADRLNRLSKRA